jgi:hypothetical protein
VNKVDALLEKTMPSSNTSPEQDAYNKCIQREKQQLSAFISGLYSQISMQMKFRLPEAIKEALETENTI